VWDGGVIEVSTDGGATWQDVGAMASPGYTGVITDQSGNPLANREAYGGQSAGFPAKEHVTIALGRSLAGKTFQLRFVIGTDQSVGAGGWRIDDLEVTGLTNKPFPRQVDDAGACNPDVDSDDGGCCQTGAPASSNLAAALLVLGAIVVRRRRRR
jgi:MYXO-CTERM domain-containing protein